ncbi:MAG: hypothetical protein NVS2B12_15230 [Ktedonobacteraceae bacterium]
METSLQRANLAVDELDTSLQADQALEEEEQHIHMPGPSWWPLLLGAAILVTVIGLLFIPDGPWLSITAAPFILVGILGWALEDPMGSLHVHEEGTEHLHGVSMPAREVLDLARAAAERIVTVSSTAYSVHPIKVEIESEDHGVILALYGKIELEAQREELEEAVRAVPGVADVKNFIIAEDTILNAAYARIDTMREQGKLDGATNLSVLVENYILHLYGDVPKTSMKYALEREAIGIPGVRVVVNHIGLNKDIPGNLGKTANKIGV